MTLGTLLPSDTSKREHSNTLGTTFRTAVSSADGAPTEHHFHRRSTQGAASGQARSTTGHPGGNQCECTSVIPATVAVTQYTLHGMHTVSQAVVKLGALSISKLRRRARATRHGPSRAYVRACRLRSHAFRRVGSGEGMGGWLSRAEVDDVVPESPAQAEASSPRADHSYM